MPLHGCRDAPGQAKALGLPPVLRTGRLGAGARRGGAAVRHDSLALAVCGVARLTPDNSRRGNSKHRYHGEGYGQGMGVGKEVDRTCSTRVERGKVEIPSWSDKRVGDDAFERDVRRGFGGRLCEKMGWKPGDGLGSKGSGDLGIVKG